MSKFKVGDSVRVYNIMVYGRLLGLLSGKAPERKFVSCRADILELHENKAIFVGNFRKFKEMDYVGKNLPAKDFFVVSPLRPFWVDARQCRKLKKSKQYLPAYEAGYEAASKEASNGFAALNDKNDMSKRTAEAWARVVQNLNRKNTKDKNLQDDLAEEILDACEEKNPFKTVACPGCESILFAQVGVPVKCPRCSIEEVTCQ